MIKISEDILSAAELCEASGKKPDEIDIEITNVSVSKINGNSSVALNIDAKLNFVMPKKIETLMKKRIISKVASADRVRINYTYTGVMIPKKTEKYEEDSYGNGYSSGSERRNGKNRNSTPACKTNRT